MRSHHIMNVLKRLLAAASIALLSACANTGKVFSDYDPDQQFTNYKKFSWLSDQPSSVSGTYPVSALSKSTMTGAIKAELVERGFVFTDNADEADFLVSFTLGARDKIATRRNIEYRVDPHSWRWGRHYYPHYFPEVVPITTERDYQFTEGSIAIDIFDAKDQRPVWHSSASKRLNRKELAGSGNKQKQAVKALLDSFPPQ